MVQRDSFWSDALLPCRLMVLLIGLVIPAFACSAAAAANRDVLLTERARLVGLADAGDVSTFEYVRPLSIGSRGHDVEAARTVLAIRGYPSSPDNGEGAFFNAGMAGAVERFQRDNRLNADGILALQLRISFEVGFLGHGLMTPAPDGPCDDESRFDAALDQTPGNTTDLLE